MHVVMSFRGLQNLDFLFFFLLQSFHARGWGYECCFKGSKNLQFCMVFCTLRALKGLQAGLFDLSWVTKYKRSALHAFMSLGLRR